MNPLLYLEAISGGLPSGAQNSDRIMLSIAQKRHCARVIDSSVPTLLNQLGLTLMPPPGNPDRTEIVELRLNTW